MVDARSYPRENIGNRAYAARKYFLRMVEARSYARGNVGNHAYAACKYILWIVEMHSYTCETFDTAANSSVCLATKISERTTEKKMLSYLVLKRPKMRFLADF